MVTRHHVGKRFGELLRDWPLLLAMTEHGLLRKAAHMHRPLDDLSATTELQEPFVAHDRHQTNIDARCVRPIDLHLAHGRGVTRMQRREIDEAQVHALAQLVGILADEKDAGDVGFNDIDGFAARSVRRRIAQEGANLALLVVGEGEDRFQACAYLKATEGLRASANTLQSAAPIQHVRPARLRCDGRIPSVRRSPGCALARSSSRARCGP